MKGEDSYLKALEEDADRIPPAPGSFYAAAPWKRIIVAVSGPLSNVAFAVLTLALVWAVGFSSATGGNRIILASDYPALAEDLLKVADPLPSQAAGLRSGDRIMSIDGKPTGTFADVSKAVSSSPGKDLSLEVERGQERLTLVLRPASLSGAGKAGILEWTDPEVKDLEPGSPALKGGLLPGDLILSAAGRPVPHVTALFALLESLPSPLDLGVSRGGKDISVRIYPDYENKADPLGIVFPWVRVENREANPFRALARGANETWDSLGQMLRGMASIFTTRNFTEAFAGPARIIVTVGETAQQGFREGPREGFASTARLLAFISLALFITNLLPIPVLDGGLVVTFLAEILMRRPLRPRTLYRVTMVGLAIVFAIFVFSSYADILHFMRR